MCITRIYLAKDCQILHIAWTLAGQYLAIFASQGVSPPHTRSLLVSKKRFGHHASTFKINE